MDLFKRIAYFYDMTRRAPNHHDLLALLYLLAAERCFHDPLTGLYNRTRLFDELERMIAATQRHRRPFVVMMIDADDFKHINDKYGHLAGDKALKDLARVLKKNLRATDFLCRYGGDEYVALLPETGQAEGDKAAQRLARAVRQKAFKPDRKARLRLSISIGLLLIKHPSKRSAIQTLHAVDQALYKAKRGNKYL